MSRRVDPEMRKRLRALFDMLDGDGEGEIRASELAGICKQLQIPATDEQLRALVREADANDSGTISFDEFVAAIMRQVRRGRGDGLDLALVTKAAAAQSFGWFDPFGWFGAGTAAEEDADDGKESPGALRARTTLGRYYAHATTARSSDSFEPTHRMKASQSLVQEENWRTAEDIRHESDTGKSASRERGDVFLARQQQRILATQQQQQAALSAVETLKEQKRALGQQQKASFGSAWRREVSKKHAHRETGRSRVLEGKNEKEAKMSVRYSQRRLACEAASARAKSERRERKEESQSTRRKEEQEARAYTARVRYETRPEVRQQGREMFQAQRNATVAQEKRQQEANSQAIDEARRRYLERQVHVRERVAEVKSNAKQMRELLAESRRQDAVEMKGLLGRERARKEMQEKEGHEQRREQREAIYLWNKSNTVEGSGWW